MNILHFLLTLLISPYSFVLLGDSVLFDKTKTVVCRTKQICLFLLAFLVFNSITGCSHETFDRITIKETHKTVSKNKYKLSSDFKKKPEARYGGYVLTATLMPHGERSAYLWAKNIGTLVSYETFLRRYSEGKYAQEFLKIIRQRFVPDVVEWREAWTLYSQMEIIDGAMVDEEHGFILIGRKGSGKMSPFFYEDLITAIDCSLQDEKIGVTMNRNFEAEFRESDNPRIKNYDTSVDFYSDLLWNTHLSYILFEADRMLKSLSSGYDIFLREEIRSNVPGFKTEIEMEAARPLKKIHGRQGGLQKYGRMWIELTKVLIITTKENNVAIFSDFKMEVRAESEHEPPIQFAKHLQENYRAYGEEFPIFAEVERAARIVAIARWLVKTYPILAQQLVDGAYDQVEVHVPQIISAHQSTIHKTSVMEHYLIGGVIYPKINRYVQKPKAKIENTQISAVPTKVVSSMPESDTLAWNVKFGGSNKGSHIAWNVRSREVNSKFSNLDTINHQEKRKERKLVKLIRD